MRVVLDTNVLLASIATHGLCQALVTLVYRDHVVVLSEHILEEVSRNYRRKFKATAARAAFFVAILRSNSEIVKPARVPRGTVKDRDDLPVLGTAAAGSADCIVTGDQELLDLAVFGGVLILSPRAFYERLRR